MKLRSIIICIALTFLLAGSAGWFFGVPYIQSRFEVTYAKGDIHYLIVAINMFRKDFDSYPQSLDELVSKDILKPFDLKLMTSRARITYFAPSSNSLDPQRILIQGDVHNRRLVGRESLEITESKIQTEQGAAANP